MRLLFHHLPPVQREPLPFSPPACGRGWGRAPKRDGPCRAARPLAPHPASPASGGGEIKAAARPAISREGLLRRRLPRHPPSRLRKGLGEGPSTRRALPGCPAAGSLPASPASGGGEIKAAARPVISREGLSRRRLPRHLPGGTIEAAPAPSSPLPLAGGAGGGSLDATGLAGLPGRWPPPGLPRKRGRRNKGRRPPRHLPGGAIEAPPAPSSPGRDYRGAACPVIPPPACGRGRGRVPRRDGPCRAARPLAPSRPPPQAGEEK